jgi:hypothetical protein
VETGPGRPPGRALPPATFDLFTEAIRQVTDLFLALAKLPG